MMSDVVILIRHSNNYPEETGREPLYSKCPEHLRTV